MRGRSVHIGNFYHNNVKRGRPTMERFNKWAEEFLGSSKLRDYDAYLWGSWPNKRDTRDIDVLITKGKGTKIDTQEMEDISVFNLEKSLVNNNILVDLGFTDERVVPFRESMGRYNKTGKLTSSNGYVYGPQWYLDDKKIKDRTDWIGPFVEVLDNNMVKLGSTHPYPKQIHSIHEFDKVYGNKPIKIKSSKR